MKNWEVAWERTGYVLSTYGHCLLTNIHDWNSLLLNIQWADSRLFPHNWTCVLTVGNAIKGCQERDQFSWNSPPHTNASWKSLQGFSFQHSLAEDTQECTCLLLRHVKLSTRYCTQVDVTYLISSLFPSLVDLYQVQQGASMLSKEGEGGC